MRYLGPMIMIDLKAFRIPLFPITLCYRLLIMNLSYRLYVDASNIVINEALIVMHDIFSAVVIGSPIFHSQKMQKRSLNLF